jgi:hypothetical protein
VQGLLNGHGGSHQVTATTTPNNPNAHQCPLVIPASWWILTAAGGHRAQRCRTGTGPDAAIVVAAGLALAGLLAIAAPNLVLLIRHRNRAG